MSDIKFSLLAIDDGMPTLDLIRSAFEDENVEVFTAADSELGIEMFQKHRPRIVLLDLKMPGYDGMEVLQKLLAIDPAAEILMMTAHYSVDSAVAAIQSGAADYLTKPLDIVKLQERVASMRAEFERRRGLHQLDESILGHFDFHGIVGRSPHLLDVLSKVRRVAPHFRTALVTGATGTGKELVARALHNLSPVASKKFAACNCSALVDTLLESELFGYVKGAFTGANGDKVGLFEYADGGTVFLDEIGDMPLAAQAKLLRVLQNQEIQRLGSPITRSVDVRVVAATNQDLRKLVQAKRFREDLYFRLNMVHVSLPALWERREDLPLLQTHFLQKFNAQYNKKINGFSRRAQRALSTYTWPGNVRELENVIGNACMMAAADFIDVDDLPEYLRADAGEAKPSVPELCTLDELARRHAQTVLDYADGNKAKAASILGISRTTLYRIINGSESAEDADPTLAAATHAAD